MRRFVLVIMILCIMVGTAGCYGSNNVVESTPTNEAPVVTQVPKTNKELYAEVLGNYFTALNYKWGKSVLYEMGLSTFLAACYEGDSYMNVGYTFLDLNADGVDELLIGPAKDEYSFKEVIFALYTLQDGKPCNIFISNERYFYLIHQMENNEYVIENSSSFSNVQNGNFFYSLQSNGLDFIDGVMLEGTIDSDSIWYRVTGDDEDVSGDEKITASEAMEILNTYENAITPEYISFKDGSILE